MIDAGHDHYFIALIHNCKAGFEVPLGYMWYHVSPDGTPCSGVVRTCRDHKEIADDDSEYWDEKTYATLTPSLLCKKCDLHGFLTNGKWQDAGSPARVNVVQVFSREQWRELTQR